MATRHDVARTRVRRTSVVVGILLAAGAALLPAQAGHADPQLDLRQAEAKLATLDHQAEQSQEQLNGLNLKTQAAQRTLAQTQSQVARSSAAVAQAQAAVGDLAAAAYRNGGVDQTLQLLLSDDPDQFLAQASALDQVSRHQSDALRTLATARVRLAQDQAAAKAQLAAITQLRDQAAAAKRQVDASVAAQNRLVANLRAEVRRQLEAQRAAERAAARAAAARAAAAQAASQAAAQVTSRPASRSNGRTSAPSAPPSAYSGSIGGRVVSFALAQVGKPYVWGASGPGAFDCSGLTMAAYATVGISLPHYTGAQWGAGRHVPASQLQPGDLVFYYGGLSHVGMYIGGGMIVHAANPRSGVTTTGLHSMPYQGAVRPY